jgi:hypothetical protein
MASVQINIPGIGNIVADNAATEETLQKILAAMQGKGAGGRGGATGGGQLSPGTLKEQEKETEARKKNTKASEESTKQTKSSGAAAEAASKYVKGLGTSVMAGTTQIGNGLIGFGRTLAQTAAAVASSFATTYDSMAENPIQAAATMMATNIDLAGAAAKTLIDVGAGLGKAASGLLGPFSAAGAGFVDAVSASAKAAVDFATTVLKMANDIMAKEFQKSADALKGYTKVGASFAGGMMEMRDIAHDSGLGIKQLTAAATASSEEIRLAGMTQADGARMMAQGMKGLATTVGKSGSNLRDEMLAMGYSYEEQAGIVAQYGAQLKASGVDVRNLAPAELARQTKDYAVNLKVISDITGQDAKKLMEKARADSMRGALMGKLDKDQQKAFKDAHATLMTLGPEAGPKMQQALMQMLAGGTVTDSVIAGNAEAMELIKKTAAGVTAGNQDMITQTQAGSAEFADKMRSDGETATSTAALMSSSFSGVGKEMATFGDSVRATSTLQVDAAQASKEAAIKQSEAVDPMTESYKKLTDSMQTFQNQMEAMASNALPAYATILQANQEQTMKLFQEGVNAAGDFAAYAKKKAAEFAEGNKPEQSTIDKTGNALEGAAKGAVAGAVVGSLVPVIGSAVGAAVGGLVGGTIGWFKGNTAQNAEGGLATPGKLNIFGEKGPEAAVPLPDGRSIPVSFDTEALTKMMGSGNDKVMEDLALAIKDLSASMSKGSQTSGPMDVIAKHLEEMKDTAVKQLDMHTSMADLMGEANNLSGSILNNSY